MGDGDNGEEKGEKPRSIVAICGAYYMSDAELTGRYTPPSGISARYFVGDDDTEIDHLGVKPRPA